MSREKRSSPRLQPFVTRCRLHWSGHARSAYLTDLSVRGARVVVDHAPPPAGTPVEIEVRFRKEARHARLAAEVKWARAAGGKGGHCVGVRFTDVGAEERALLERIIEEFHSQAARIG